MTKIKSKEMSNITIIVPMNDLNDKNLELLDKALSSVPNDFEVLISCKKGTDTSSLKGNVITTAEGDSFQELVNSAVESVGSAWFWQRLLIISRSGSSLCSWYCPSCCPCSSIPSQLSSSLQR